MVLGKLLILAPTLAALASDWSPPPNPNPQAILREARADATAGRNENALAKYVWFHHNAVKLNKALYGVRNSFAVSDWARLGKAYAPALAKMRETRDAALEDVKQGKNTREAFGDVVAINRALGEDDRTHELFLHLDAKQPEMAKQVYRIAQRILIEKKEYKLCGKYLDLEEATPRLTKSVQYIPEIHRVERFSPSAKARIIQMHIDGCATFIALLAINGRHDDAVKVANALRKEWDDPGFHSAMDRALKGELPKR